MSSKSLPLVVLLFCAVFMCFAQNQPVELTAQVGSTFRFAFLGDTRFTNPKDTRDSNATVRQTLVQAIADARPAFVSIGGDIVYNGDDANDWKTWDVETAIWHKHGIAMYPVLGNHDLSGGRLALDNYFQRFPELKNSRYYAVRAGNALLLVLDSSLAELSGPQGEWFAKKLDATPSDVEFVFILLHHPPYTSSSDEKVYGGGHSARSEGTSWAKCWSSGSGLRAPASWCSPAMFTTTSATNTMGSHILSAEAVGHTPTALRALRETHFQTTTSTIISCLSRSNTAS